MEQNQTFPNTLTPSQIKLLELLGAGHSISQASKEAGVGRGAFYRWRSECPEFMQSYSELIASLWNQTKDELKSLASTALQVLTRTMTDENASHKDRLAAASIVLSNLHKIVTDDELRKRVEALVLALEADKNAGS